MPEEDHIGSLFRRLDKVQEDDELRDDICDDGSEGNADLVLLLAPLYTQNDLDSAQVRGRGKYSRPLTWETSFLKARNSKSVCKMVTMIVVESRIMLVSSKIRLSSSNSATPAPPFMGFSAADLKDSSIVAQSWNLVCPIGLKVIYTGTDLGAATQLSDV